MQVSQIVDAIYPALPIFAQNLVSNIEDVDIAQATSELAFNEVQLQGSFMTLARLQSLSLLDFL